MLLKVNPGEYMDKLVEYCMVKVYSMIRVVDTNQTWSGEEDFMMDKPRLEIEEKLKYFNENFTNKVFFSLLVKPREGICAKLRFPSQILFL